MSFFVQQLLDEPAQVGFEVVCQLFSQIKECNGNELYNKAARTFDKIQESYSLKGKLDLVQKILANYSQDSVPGDKTVIQKLVRTTEDPLFGLRYFQAICISRETFAYLGIDASAYCVINLTDRPIENALNVKVELRK